MTEHTDVEAMIGDCETRESRLSAWERSFIESINAQWFEYRRPLTDKQYQTLSKIWDRATENG